jgi:hypothetical protein
VKKKINEKLGGGARIGLGGTNSAGPYYDYYKTQKPTGYHTGGYTGNADSQISQRHALISTLDEIEEEDMEDKEENLMEFFARIMKMPLTESDKKNLEENHCNIKEGHCETHESHCTISEKHCDEAIRMMEEQELEEMSVAGSIAGATTPLGTDARGEISSSARRKSRLDHAKRTFGGI